METARAGKAPPSLGSRRGCPLTCPLHCPVSPAPNTAARREEPARAGPSALPTPAPRRLARRRRGVPARGTATAAGCPFTPPSTCSPLLFGNGGGEEARPSLRVAGRGWHRYGLGPGPRVTRGSRTFQRCLCLAAGPELLPSPPPSRPEDRAAELPLSGEGRAAAPLVKRGFRPLSEAKGRRRRLSPPRSSQHPALLGGICPAAKLPQVGTTPHRRAPAWARDNTAGCGGGGGGGGRSSPLSPPMGPGRPALRGG